jgi:hypothetical protein
MAERFRSSRLTIAILPSSSTITSP